MALVFLFLCLFVGLLALYPLCYPNDAKIIWQAIKDRIKKGR